MLMENLHRGSLNQAGEEAERKKVMMLYRIVNELIRGKEDAFVIRRLR